MVGQLRSNGLRSILCRFRDVGGVIVAVTKEPLAYHWRSKHGGIVGAQLFSQHGARAHSCPVQRSGAVKQAFERNNGAIVQAWRALSDYERDTWRDFGQTFPGTDKYGNPVAWGGYQWFTRCNSRVCLAGGAVISEPPPSDVCGYDPVFWAWFDFGSGWLYLSFDPEPGAGQWVRVWFRGHCLQSIGSPPLPLPGTDPIVGPWPSPVVLAMYVSLAVVGERHWVRAQAGDEYGLASPAWSNFVDT